MKIRKIVSMTVLVSFLLLVFNSVVLFVMPEGRIAYWANWRLLGLSKTEWGDQHLTVGVLFLVAGLIHILYNWRPIVSYLRNSARKVSVLSLPLAVGVGITLLVAAGTYWQVAPMRTVVEFGRQIKAEAAQRFGEPPYGHAELSSLATLCKKEGFDPATSMAALRRAGMEVGGDRESLRQIAAKNHVTPQHIYTILKEGRLVEEAGAQTDQDGKAVAFPDQPRPGFGRLTLDEACQLYHLDTKVVIAGLAGMGIAAKPDQTVREIGAQSNREPMEIFEAIRSLVVSR